mgnify:CR=1 FL=1|jgi:hypothetical protein
MLNTCLLERVERAFEVVRAHVHRADVAPRLERLWLLPRERSHDPSPPQQSQKTRRGSVRACCTTRRNAETAVSHSSSFIAAHPSLNQLPGRNATLIDSRQNSRKVTPESTLEPFLLRAIPWAVRRHQKGKRRKRRHLSGYMGEIARASWNMTIALASSPVLRQCCACQRRAIANLRPDSSHASSNHAGSSLMYLHRQMH